MIQKHNKELPALQEIDIKVVEAEMLKQDQVDCPVVHRFGPGVYMREVTMPAGAMIVGHHQNLEHLNIFLKGKMTLLMDDKLFEISAPMTFTAGPGRKIAQIHEDSVWLNVYPNVENEQDVEVLEDKYLTKSEEFVLSEEKRNSILLGNRKSDVSDYQEAIKELGIKEATLEFKEIMSLPYDGFKIKIAKSRIHNKGLFATAELVFGESIGPVQISGKVTVLAKYVNHSRYPNSRFVLKKDGNIDLVAIEKIYGCRGGFDGDEITVDYRDAFSGGFKCQE